MRNLKLLLIEDEESAVEACRTSVERYMHEKERPIKLCVCESVRKAKERLDNSFDGAIIDLKLSDEEDGGVQVVQEIEESLLRLPVFVLTGYPNYLDEDFRQSNTNIIRVFVKGEPDAEYDQILDRLWSIYETGLTRIMGGRGKIEDSLSKVFLKNLLPHMETWESYGKVDPKRTEKALLRHTLNHLSQLLEEDMKSCFPEEMYLAPPLNQDIRPGSIVKEKKNDRWFVVMNPACDLVVRGNCERNTDRVLVAEVDPDAALFPWIDATELSNAKKGELRTAFRNNRSTYYHWLPRVDFFPGGFLNFRKLSALEEKKFSREYETPPQIQIAPSFVKDVIARFSSYYARQGQPDIDFERFLSE